MITLRQAINKQLRSQKKTVEEMVQFMGMSRANYNKAIKHKRIALEHLESIAAFLNISVIELLKPVYE